MKAIILSLLLIAVIITPTYSTIFKLSFDYVARQGVDFQGCLANVIWNNNIVVSVVPTDYALHTVNVEVTAVVGENSLQFEGAGYSDSTGLGIGNVVLIKKGDPANRNVIVNGDFSQPKVAAGTVEQHRTIKGWTAYGAVLQIGDASTYSPAWPVNTQAIELDATVNFEMTQILIFDGDFKVIDTPPYQVSSDLLPPPSYFLSFDWAPNTVGTSNLRTSQANVLWNNVVLDTLIPTNTGVNHYSKQVVLSSSNLNTLQFDGVQNNDGLGVSISNVMLKVKQSSNTNLVNGNWSATNPLFTRCTTFNIEWTASQCFSLDTGTNQRYTQKITIIVPVQKAFDVVGPLTRTAFGCLKQQGYVYANIAAFSYTIGQINPYTIQTLQNAKAAGLKTAIYTLLCLGDDIDTQLAPILNGIDTSLYSTFWFKIVSNLNPVCKWSNASPAQNCLIIAQALFKAYQSTGIKVGIFSTKNIWAKTFGNDCPLGSFGLFYAWYGNYQSFGFLDPSQTFADYVPFGGFQNPALKQIIGGVRVTLCNNPMWTAFISVDYTS